MTVWKEPLRFVRSSVIEMPEELKKTSSQKTFKQRLFGSIIVFLLVFILFGSIGLFLFFLSATKTTNWLDKELLKEDFPPRQTLLVKDGIITKLSYRGDRRGTFVNPTIEYEIEGKKYQIRTIADYDNNQFPFSQNQTVEVLYVPAQPEKAWLAWEYDRVIGDYESAKAPPLITRVSRIYNYIALALLSLFGLFLLINLFFPLFRSTK